MRGLPYEVCHTRSALQSLQNMTAAQNTLKSPVVLEGVGLHSGASVRMVIRPAGAGHGIRFRRSDIALGDALIPARYDAVARTPLCTRIVNAAGAGVSTIEHLMAALAGAGVDNALIEIDGPEVPILDGSSLPFLRAIMAAGLRPLDAPVEAWRVMKPVTVTRDGARASLLPCDRLRIEFHIDFADGAIGRQSRVLDMDNGAFARELSDSRTFCRLSDVHQMRRNGLGRGGSLDNAVVVDGDRVLTPGGLRHADEPVRHKMLDALGDLALAGAPVLGHYVGERAGHVLTNTLLRKAFATPGVMRRVTCDARTAARLPGRGLRRAEIPAVA